MFDFMRQLEDLRKTFAKVDADRERYRLALELILDGKDVDAKVVARFALQRRPAAEQ